MKSTWVATVLAAAALGFPVSAYADDLGSKWAGTYSTKETNFVTVKRLTFTKEKDGSLKVRGALVGFPDEVSIGEATAEAYANRNDKPNPDTIVVSFSSEKHKALMVITPFGQWDGKHYSGISFRCYTKDADGSKVHIDGNLTRE